MFSGMASDNVMTQAATSSAFVSGRCVPTWSANPVHLERQPWMDAPFDTATERYRCPACGGQVRTTFHGRLRRP